MKGWHFVRGIVVVMLVAGCGDSGGKTEATPEQEGVIDKSAKNTGKSAKRPKTTSDNRLDETAGTDSGSAATGGFEQEPPLQPTARVYRASDKRRKHNDDQLADLGIRRYTSKRLILYSDIDPEAARGLPVLMDEAYDAWEEYFGPLPPDREGTDFQMTGYLIGNKALFRETGMLPDDLPPFPHGRHLGQEFWLNDQSTDYYRRHLLLHEGTHCFMTAVPHRLLQHVWYMEGMAEAFGTHQLDENGKTRFNVLPDDRTKFAGLGRIRLIEDEVRATGPRSFTEVNELGPDEFSKNRAYAWSWGLCKFLDSHPRYGDQFRKASKQVTGGGIGDDFPAVFADDFLTLQEEWLLFAAHLCHGYDTRRAAIRFIDGDPLQDGREPLGVEIAADRGWQSTGVRVEQGRTYLVTASGRFVVAQAEPLWESEPQGISFRYHAGYPVGLLLGAIRKEPPVANRATTTLLNEIPIGRGRRITAEVSGTLYLRVNDFWNEMADNSGSVAVTIKSLPADK